VVDVFEQVEEEIRSDRYKRLARTWLPVVGGILVVALVAALAWWGWQSWQTAQADKASAAYDRGMEALEASNPAGADAAFTEAAKVAPSAYKALALMQRAGIAVTAGKNSEAITLFDEAAKVANDPIIADPAALKAAWLVMDTDASLADIEKRLEPLTAEGRPLRPFAQEALGLARLQHGKLPEAREIFVLLQRGLDVPDPIKQRAQIAIAAIDSGTASSLGAVVAAQALIPATPAAPAGANGAAPAQP
tara:strand:- start:290 stop:1036 length:747 start_codon:yes stop_codon:yes gene_type:complete